MKRLVIENKLATLGYYHIHVFDGDVNQFDYRTIETYLIDSIEEV